MVEIINTIKERKTNILNTLWGIRNIKQCSKMQGKRGPGKKVPDFKILKQWADMLSVGRFRAMTDKISVIANVLRG